MAFNKDTLTDTMALNTTRKKNYTQSLLNRFYTTVTNKIVGKRYRFLFTVDLVAF